MNLQEKRLKRQRLRRILASPKQEMLSLQTRRNRYQRALVCGFVKTPIGPREEGLDYLIGHMGEEWYHQ